jgi:hypothetical protein
MEHSPTEQRRRKKMPITSTNKEDSLNPGQTVAVTDFKGTVRIKNESSEHEAICIIQFSSGSQEGRLSPLGELKVPITELQKKVDVANRSKEAKITVDFMPG